MLAILGLTSSQTAAAEAVQVTLEGIGTRTCSYWLSKDASRSEGTVWIYGFWSGLNYVAAASQQPQSIITGTALIDAVEKVCGRDASVLLATAAWTAYVERSAR